MPETTVPSLRLRQLLAGNDIQLFNFLKNHLCNPIATLDLKRLAPKIEKNDSDLTPVILVDGAGAV